MEKQRLQNKKLSIKDHWSTILLFVFHSSVFIYFLSLGFYIVNNIKPMPTSDFIYYWNLASDVSIYHKGGIIGFIYAPFKLYGLEPYWSALIVNSFFLSLVYGSSWLSFKKYSTRYGFVGQLLLTAGLAMFGLWNAGYAGMVNADFPNVALLIGATRGFSLFGSTKNKKWLYIGGLLLFLAVALRVKTGLALGIIILLLIIFHFRSIKREKAIQLVILVVCISVGLAAISEVLLRNQSLRQEDVARQGRLQLYTGLLYTSTGPMCGRWTREAFDKTLEELDEPFLTVIDKHLSVKSKRYILEIIECKISAVFNYDDFSYRELLAFGVKHRAYTETDIMLIKKYETIEEKWVQRFKILVYIVLIASLLLSKKLKVPLATLPIAIYFAFMALHSVFEIQARYMVEPLLWSYYAAILLIFEVSTKQVILNDEEL